MHSGYLWRWMGILVGCLVVGGVVCERGMGEEPVRRPAVAVFVKNRIGPAGESQVVVLEELLAARLSGMGYRVISSRDVLEAVLRLVGGGAGGKEADPEAMVAESSSALRLAQNLGADYLLVVSMATLTTRQQRTEVYGTERTFLLGRLGLAYRLVEAKEGASVEGGTAEVESRMLIRPDQPEAGPVPAILPELVSRGAEVVVSKLSLVPLTPSAGEQVNWTVICGASGLVVPAIYQDEKGQWVVGQEKLTVAPMNVTVELDGVVIGTAPGTFQVRPGLHQVRLSRAGYEDFQGTVNIAEGQTLRIDLRMTEAEYARWKEMTGFLESLKVGAKLSDAQVEALRGYAQMLRQSGCKVDVQKKIDVEEKVKAEGKPGQMNFWTMSW